MSVEELVEAWQDTQGDVCLLLSPLLTPALEETPEIRAKHRQVLTCCFSNQSLDVILM